jgi:hypothetical protein
MAETHSGFASRKPGAKAARAQAEKPPVVLCALYSSSLKHGKTASLVLRNLLGTLQRFAAFRKPLPASLLQPLDLVAYK